MPPSTKWALQMLVGPLVDLSVCRSFGRPYLVRMITRHRIDLDLSNLAQSCVSGCRRSLFEVNRSKVKVTVTINILTYRPNFVRMITRQRIDLGLSNVAQAFVLECR